MRRREFLAAPVAMMASPSARFGIKALTFDVFGTVVDWRGSIIREGARWGPTKSLNVDWPKFADRWRAGYGPASAPSAGSVLPELNRRLDAVHG